MSWAAPGSCRRCSDEQTCTPTARHHTAGRCMPDSLETTLMPTLWPFHLGGGGGGKAKAVPSREMCYHFFKTDKSLSWHDQVFNRAATNGQFWHVDIGLTLVPPGVLYLCPSCRYTGPDVAATAASLTSAAAGSWCWLEHRSEQWSHHEVCASCTCSPASESLNVIVGCLRVPNRALKRG